jgi:hypothetical protein
MTDADWHTHGHQCRTEGTVSEAEAAEVVWRALALETRGRQVV